MQSNPIATFATVAGANAVTVFIEPLSLTSGHSVNTSLAMGDCTKCTARCCNYISTEIDEPETREDFDQLLWQIAHQDVSIYVDEGEWHLSFNTRCRFLNSDFSCGIYEHRPQLCRDHSDDVCAYDGEYDFEMEFQNYEELKSYIDVYFSKDGEKKVKKLRKQWAPKSWVSPDEDPRPVEIKNHQWRNPKTFREGKPHAYLAGTEE
tara:strand:- start:595 stop:1212 length:618 start_codon:yes stop_codon:yes gene_type:complete